MLRSGSTRYMKPPEHERSGAAFDRQIARIAVGAYDDAQETRKAMLNRVRDVIRKKREGIPFDKVEDEKEDQDYSSEYQDDELPDLIEEMREEGTLTDREHDYLQDMIQAGEAAARIENTYQSVMSITEVEPVYSNWLTEVTGVSHTLTARLLHQYGYCEDFDKVSQLWSYSGFAPGQKRTRGEKLGYSPEAKTLGWNIATSMIRQGENSRYRREFYDPYKEKQMDRLEWDEEGFCVKCGLDPQVDDDDLYVCQSCYQDDSGNPSPPESKQHADNRARRYLAKKFLKHYWAIARAMEGLETPDEWVLTHGGHEKREDTFENPFYAWEVTVNP